MNTTYWGVDSSYYPANKQIRIRGRKMTVWEYICDEAAVLKVPSLKATPDFDIHLEPMPDFSPRWPTATSTIARPPVKLASEVLPPRKPDFWGRYLGRHQITREEADYIFASSGGGCRILLVYNLTSQPVVGGNHQRGLAAANDAITRAAALGVPAGTFIYCDIEGVWTPSVEFLQGWWEAMENSVYGGRGGIYCRTDVPNFCRPFLRAVRVDNPMLRPEPDIAARYLWTTRPQIARQTKPGHYQHFAPIDPADGQGVFRGVSVVHQYSLDKCKGMVDFNIANQRGYDGMWSQD